MKKMFACSRMYLAETSPVWNYPLYFQEFKTKTKKNQISCYFLVCLRTAKLTCEIKYNMQPDHVAEKELQMQNQWMAI